jgi:hypothetical protein
MVGYFFDAALDNPIHDADVLRETASSRLKAGSEAHSLINGALGIELALAIKTFTAGNVVEGHDAVADFEPRYAGPSGSNHTRGFMAENAGRIEQIVLDFLKVCMANAACLDSYQDFAGADCRRWDFLDPNRALAAVHGGSHGSRNTGIVLLPGERLRVRSKQKILPGYGRPAHNFAATGIAPETGPPDDSKHV